LRARVAVLVSGGGRSLENLAELAARGELGEIELALVISSSPKAFALERAKRLGLPALVIAPRAHESPAAFGQAVFDAVEASEADLVVLAGFLHLLPIPPAWSGRVINIHPALLPKYGGKGFYGERVHQAVLAAGERESGCTVHYVTEEYDRGPHILQLRVPVLAGDTPETLAARVFEAEKRALPEAIRRHFASRPPPSP
jgi:formyltetrahydrofolate-dependent phosphoribosylglycinamide formyltransferase